MADTRKCRICGELLLHPHHSIFDPEFSHGFQEGATKMATKATIDPLAGIPVATPRPARPAKAAANAPTTIAQGKANLKRKRLTGEEWKQARDFARKTTGYNDTSPIWGKRMPVVLVDIESLIDAARESLGRGDYGDAMQFVDDALVLNRELQKRLATGQLIGAQS